MTAAESEPRRPQDICLETWSKIAQAMEPAGFKLVKGRRLRHLGRNFREEIVFQPSTWNRSGILVLFRANAILWHQALGRWRAAGRSPVSVTDWFAGQNLSGEDGSEWNLVQPQSRAGVIDDVTNSIHRDALPWFGLLNATETLVHAATIGDVPHVDIDALVEYLVFLGRRQEAERVLTGWIDRWGSTERAAGFAPRLHRLASHYDLSVNLPAVPDMRHLESAVAQLLPIQYVEEAPRRRSNR